MARLDVEADGWSRFIYLPIPPLNPCFIYIFQWKLHKNHLSIDHHDVTSSYEIKCQHHLRTVLQGCDRSGQIDLETKIDIQNEEKWFVELRTLPIHHPKENEDEQTEQAHKEWIVASTDVLCKDADQRKSFLWRGCCLFCSGFYGFHSQYVVCTVLFASTTSSLLHFDLKSSVNPKN